MISKRVPCGGAAGPPPREELPTDAVSLPSSSASIRAPQPGNERKGSHTN